MNKCFVSYSICTFMGLIVLLFCSCNDVESNVNSVEGPDYVRIIPVFQQNRSRAGLSDLTQDFYLYAFEGKSVRGKNIHYSYVSDAWSAESEIIWPSGEEFISFYGLSQPFANGDGISNLKMNYKNQYFDFYSDPDNPKELLYASTINTTRTKQKGAVTLAFGRSLASPYFTCVQGIENVTIIVSEVIVHNLVSTATLTFNSSFDSYAEWTLLKSDGNYANYSQKLDSPVTLNPDMTTAVQISKEWKWIPQKPTKWSTKKTMAVPITTADANHESYVELKCKIIQNGNYVWGGSAGSSNEYESVYFPFSTNFNAQAYNNAIRLKFSTTGAYMEDGTPFKPREGAQFTLANWVTEDLWIDPWEEEEPEDLIF